MPLKHNIADVEHGSSANKFSVSGLVQQKNLKGFSYLFACLFPIAVNANNFDNNGVVNRQFDRIAIYNLGDGQCTNRPDSLSDINFNGSPTKTINSNKIQIGSHENWSCGDSFGDYFAGDIYIPANESITFYLNSDDGSELLVNGVELIDNDGVHSDQELNQSIVLAEGWHFIEVKYFNKVDPRTLSLSYSSATIGAKQEVPQSALRLGNGLDIDNDGTLGFYDNDDDGDGVADNLDAFPLDSSESTDTDSDGIGNNADLDDDGDGVSDDQDAFPLDPTETIDTDNDGVGNNLDTDDDNDGVSDDQDAFPLDATETVDTDNDGVGNNADTDDDGDGVSDDQDAFPLDASESTDTDGDGIGNNADTDDDNDGHNDDQDAFPLDPIEHADFDGDGIGDNADNDNDNDGMPDDYENANGLNPAIDDAYEDADGDRAPNIFEYVSSTDPNDAFDNKNEFIDGWQNNGQQTWDFLEQQQVSSALELVLEHKNGVLLVGNRDPQGQDESIEIVRVDYLGQKDTSYGNGGHIIISESYNLFLASAYVNELGELFVAVRDGDEENSQIFKYDADGQLDNSFADSGKLTINAITDTVFDLATLDNGELVVVGTDSGATAKIWMFNADGSVKQAFGHQGTINFGIPGGGTSQKAYKVLPQNNKFIIAVSGFVNATEKVDSYLFRLETTGGLDSTFNNNQTKVKIQKGASEIDIVSNLTTRSDGKFWLATSSYAPMVQLYNANGTLDTSFANAGVLELSTENGHENVAFNDNYIIQVGEPADYVHVNVYNKDGGADKAFGFNGTLEYVYDQEVDVRNAHIINNRLWIVGIGYYGVDYIDESNKASKRRVWFATQHHAGSDFDLDGIKNQIDSDQDGDRYSDSDESDAQTDYYSAKHFPLNDQDRDYVSDVTDNCIGHYNPTQGDFNSNGTGDACQDTDGDGVFDDEELIEQTDPQDAGNRPAWTYSITADIGESAFLGFSLASAGDVNKDGIYDFIIGARSGENENGDSVGVVQVISGKDKSVIHQFYGEAKSDNFGYSVDTVGDINKDGHADVIIGAKGNDEVATSAGAAYVYSGKDGTLLHKYLGQNAGDQFGTSVSFVGDVNNDDYPDFAVAAPIDKYNWGAGVSYVNVYSGQDGSLIHKLDGFNDFDQLGYKLATLGDVNGDLHDDFLVGSMHNDVDGDLNGDSSGTVRLYSGIDGSVLYTLTGEDVNDGFPYSINDGDDINKDGIRDFVVGMHGSRSKANVYSGVDGALISSYTGDANTSFGREGVILGDINKDELPDVLIGAGYTFNGNGAAHFFDGKTEQQLLSIYGGNEQALGQYINTAGDFDGDGQTDVMVTYAGDNNYAGLVRVFTAKGLSNDLDFDHWVDSSDNCPTVGNNNQNDTDGDGYGDVCDDFPNDSEKWIDNDADGDGVADENDAFPQDPSEWLDTDGDGVGNNADTDDDNDGYADDQDALPLDPSDHLDGDGDGIGDSTDTDFDNDGYANNVDTAPNDPLVPGLSPLYIKDGSFYDINFGNALTTIDDIDGDGVNEIVVGAQYEDTLTATQVGSVTVLSGRTGKEIYKILGENKDDRLGYHLGAGRDFNSDGVQDILVTRLGANGSFDNALDVISGKDGSLIYQIQEEFSRFAYAYTTIDDLNSDLVPDIVVSASTYQNAEGKGVGAVIIYSGADGSMLTTIEGTVQGGFFGHQFSIVPDANGDGKNDLLISAPYVGTAQHNYVGQISLISGADYSEIYRVTGQQANQKLGRQLFAISDVNNDLIDDFVYTIDNTENINGVDRGMVVIASGKTGEVIDKIYSDNYAQYEFGYRISALGDVNGDGFDEIGILDTETGWQAKSSLYVYSTADKKVLARINRDQQHQSQYLGLITSNIGDINSDGIAEIVLADYSADGVSSNVGAVSVYSIADTWLDLDGDGLVNGIDNDKDNDGLLNDDDHYPYIPIGALTDTDSDGIPNVCDASCQQNNMEADVYSSGIIYVDASSSCDASNSTCGQSWNQAFKYLQDAIAVARTGTQIWLAEGVYYPHQSETQEIVGDIIAFTLPKNVSLIGGFESGANATSVEQADSTLFKSVLSGDIDFTSMPDQVDADGIGASSNDISGNNTKYLLQTVTENQSNAISGLYLTGVKSDLNYFHTVVLAGGSTRFSDITFSGVNSLMQIRADGGCQIDIEDVQAANITSERYNVYIEDSSCNSINFKRVQLENVYSNNGYPVFYIEDSQTVINLNDFSMINDALGSSDAFEIEYSDGDTLINIANSTFYRTGTFYSYESLSIENSTFVGTGGIEMHEDEAFSVIHSTFINNDIGAYAGAIESSSSETRLGFNLFAGNVGTQADNIYLGNGANIIDLGYNIVGDSGNHGVVARDGRTFENLFDSGSSTTSEQTVEQLVSTSLADNGGNTLTLAIPETSEAYDAYRGTCLLSTDQRGLPRPAGEACDIGAFEIQPVQQLPDFDGDGIPDATDPDDDNDGVNDDVDAFPRDPNETLDTDGDGVGNNADADDDNDGVNDGVDAFPFDPSESTDTDGDGVGNNADTDDDNDGVADEQDAFPFDPSESTDTDGDGIGNNADSDDDNDGIPDEHDDSPLVPNGDEQAPVFDEIVSVTFEATGFETIVSLTVPTVTDNQDENPTVVSNLSGGLSVGSHTVTWTATDSSGNSATATQQVNIVDTKAPIITAEKLSINAMGALTNIESLIDASANDLVDGNVQVTLQSEVNLPSGKHVAIVSAFDSAGNTSSESVDVEITPNVQLQAEAYTSAGSIIELSYTLSGEAIIYPVSLDYELTVNGGLIEQGNVSLNQGINGLMSINIPANVSNADEILVTIVNAENTHLALTESAKLVIVEENVAPTLAVSLSQNGLLTSVVDALAGPAMFELTIEDFNALDEHELVWSFNDPTIPVIVEGQTLTIDPSFMLPDLAYYLEVTVTENNTEEQYSTTHKYHFVVEAGIVLDSNLDSDGDGIADDVEGVQDSDQDGIADYLDDNSDPTVLPSSKDTLPLSTTPGLKMSLGSLVKASDGSTASDAGLTLEELANSVGEGAASVENENYQPVTPIYNFTISGLNTPGDIIQVVIPLEDGTEIPAGAIYQKYNTRDGWFDFVENDKNAIHSAAKDASGNCPVAGSEAYSVGLTQAYQCIQLSIEDGGPNDADFNVNGAVEDPGAIVVSANSAPVIVVDNELSMNENDTMIIDASHSYDIDGQELSFSWSAQSGSGFELENETTAILTVNSSNVLSDQQVEVLLTVSDGQTEIDELILITILRVNQLPDVNVTTEKSSYSAGQSVKLTASATDADDDELSYQWTQISGANVALVNSNQHEASFIVPALNEQQTLSFNVEVSDGYDTVNKTISIVVLSQEKPEVAKEESSGGAIGLILIVLMYLRLYGRLSKSR